MGANGGPDGYFERDGGDAIETYQWKCVRTINGILLLALVLLPLYFDERLRLLLLILNHSCNLLMFLHPCSFWFQVLEYLKMLLTLRYLVVDRS